MQKKREAISRALDSPINMTTDQTLINIIIDMEDEYYTSDKTGTVTINKEPHEIMMAIDVIQRPPEADKKRFEGIIIQAMTKKQVDIIKNGRRALWVLNLHRSLGSQAAQRNAIEVWIDERLRERNIRADPYVLTFYNRHQALYRPERHLIEHCGLIWCTKSCYDTLYNIIGDSSGGFYFELHNRESNRVIPVSCPDYTNCISIRGLSSELTLHDIEKEITANMGKILVNIWCETTERLQSSGLIVCDDKLQDTIYILVTRPDLTFDILKRCIGLKAERNSKIKAIPTILPGTDRESLCYSLAIKNYFAVNSNKSKENRLIATYIAYANKLHDEGVAPQPHEYIGVGSRLFPIKKKRQLIQSNNMVVKKKSSELETFQPDYQERVQELLDTISSLKSNQDVILKTVATLQTQITTQEHRQTELELHTTMAQLDAEKTKSDFQLQLQDMETKRQEREKRLELKFRENEQKFIKLQQLQDDLSYKMDEEEIKKKHIIINHKKI